MPASSIFDTWSRVAGLYRDAAQSDAQQLAFSSAAIVQEHTTRAFMQAAQSCADALAKNAFRVQQASFERLLETNQKALGMMGSAWADAWFGKTQRN